MRLGLTRFIICAGLMLVMAGCTQSDYGVDALEGVDRNQWPSVARKMPLDERLELYDEVYRKSGHPPDTIISRAFDNEGVEAFNLVLGQVRTSQDLIRYWSVLHALDRSDQFSICAAENLEPLKARAGTLELSTIERNELEFENCSLF